MPTGHVPFLLAALPLALAFSTPSYISLPDPAKAPTPALLRHVNAPLPGVVTRRRKRARSTPLSQGAATSEGRSDSSEAALSPYHPIRVPENALLLNEEPPVYMVPDLVSAEDCDALVRLARDGRLQPLTVSGAFVELDKRRLLPLVPLALLGAATFATFHEGAFGSALAGEALIMGLLSLGVPWAVATFGTKATYNKWACEAIANEGAEGGREGGKEGGGNGGTEARLLSEALLARAAAILDTTPSRFEGLTVTQYLPGGHQKKHIDTYPPGAESALEQGGQRLANCLVYLHDECEGGRTLFHDPSLGGLAIAPRRGAAVFFFPAFADGRSDDRMLHSGETVTGGEKWIVNSWLRQTDAPRARW